jgi:hypothetical protein
MATPVETPPVARRLELEAWPQPARDVLHVRVDGGTGSAHIVLTDLLGREQLRTHIEHGTAILDFSGLARGVYLLRATRGSESVVRRIMR